jgi:hypothetical protein
MNTLTATPCKVCESRAYVEHVDVTIDADVFRVCDVCLADHDGPGKFEGPARDGDEQLALALVLQSLDLDGCADHFLSDESGYAAAIDRFILTIDSSGFVDVQEYVDSAVALDRMNDFEGDGFGAQGDDGWISCERGGYFASLGGKRLGTFERLTRAQAAISLEMRRSGYFPNVFLAGEHGHSVRRVDVW